MRESYRVHRSTLYKMLGFKSDRIPASYSGRFDGMLLPASNGWYRAEMIPGVWNVVVTQATGAYAKHRIFVKCRCGRLIPVGRLDQHMRTCNANNSR